MFQTHRVPDDLLAPGQSATAYVLRQAMGDGVGGSLEVTTWMTLFSPPSKSKDPVSVGVQIFDPAADDPTKAIWGKQYTLDPGRVANEEMPAGQFIVEATNNGAATVDDGKGGQREAEAFVAFGCHQQPR